MTELERTLRELGRELKYPPTPDLAPAVRRRLAARPARRWTWPRAAAIAFAMLVAGAAAVLAVPPARSAVLDWLGIGGVSIERVSTLPRARATGLDLGRLVRIAEARELVDYEIVLSEVEGGRPEGG